MVFRNATPRPWSIRTSRDASHDVGITAAGLNNVLAETFADIRHRGERSAIEARANADLIVAAVNTHDRLVDVLTEVMGWISNWDPSFIHDDEWTETQQRVEEILELAKKGAASGE